MALIDRPPGWALRAALRAPAWLYRLHLGWLLGSRFLCVSHRGRVSGRLRRTVLETVRFRRHDPEVVAVAAWGEEAQWYRNLRSEPAIEVRVGRRRWRRPEQRFLSEPERRGVLREYVAAHPLAARELGRVLGFPELGSGDVEATAQRTRAVAFVPGRGPAASGS